MAETKDRLKETQASILRQLKFNISRRRAPGADQMTRDIGSQDKMLTEAMGEEKVAETVAKMVESVDVYSQEYDVFSGSTSGFSFRNLKEALYEAEDSGKLREAGAESMYGGLLRLGVTNLVAKAYKLVPLVWDKVLMTNAINGLFGVYGSTFRPGMPSDVGAGEEFPETTVDPMDNIVAVKKWGYTLQFQNELIEDDQTGELATKASEAGENMGLYQELSFAAFLSDKAITQAGLTITPPTYTDPDTTTGVYKTSGKRKNAPSSFGAIGMNTLKVARSTLKAIQQPNGVKVMVNPNMVVYHPDDENNVLTLFRSPVWPSSSNQNSSTPGDSTGSVNAYNPLGGYGYALAECRYLNNGGSNGGSWFLGQAKSRSLIYQIRDGLQTLQENPAAGKSFDRDLSRWRNRQRGSFTWLLGGARFWYAGNIAS